MAASTTYTFQRCLGRGGFGEVYLAVRSSAEGLERRVAVKVLREDLPNADLALARLRDEGRMLAALDHPAIVTVLELTRLRGRIALVTEYVEGTDLARFCMPTRLLPPRVVVSIAAEVAGALHSAWVTTSPETGKPLHLIHRDIKPENVRLSKHGDVKVLDFGIARSGEMAREARTSTGNLPFTPGYTAPEAFVSLEQGAPTDVYALGATLFRLVTADRLYEQMRVSDQAALASSREQYAVFLDHRMRKVPEIHSHFTKLIRACLAYDPAARPDAATVQVQSEQMCDEVAGPSPKRWAREMPALPERTVEGASLAGLTLTEDDPEHSFAFAIPKRRPPSAVPAPPEGVVSARPVTRSMSVVDRPRTDAGVVRAHAPVVTVPAGAEPFPWWAASFALVAFVFAAVAVAGLMVVTGVWLSL